MLCWLLLLRCHAARASGEWRREPATTPAWVLSRGMEMAKTENRKPEKKRKRKDKKSRRRKDQEKKSAAPPTEVLILAKEPFSVFFCAWACVLLLLR